MDERAVSSYLGITNVFVCVSITVIQNAWIDLKKLFTQFLGAKSWLIVNGGNFKYLKNNIFWMANNFWKQITPNSLVFIYIYKKTAANQRIFMYFIWTKLINKTILILYKNTKPILTWWIHWPQTGSQCSHPSASPPQSLLFLPSGQLVAVVFGFAYMSNRSS